MSQYVPTRYKVLYIIDKRYRVKIYVREVRWYIYVAQGPGPCIRVAITTREVSAVTVHPPSKRRAPVSQVTAVKIQKQWR